jgi:hypothetical protein
MLMTGCHGSLLMMMLSKVFVGAAAAAAALALSTGTVAAAPGQTQSNGPIADQIPLTCAGGFTGVTSYTGIGNSIVHHNGNSNGDWDTMTQEGTVILVISPNGGTYTGHVQDWFGAEANKQNFVVHATLNFIGTNVADGTAFQLHANFDITTNAAGATTASHFNVTCS